MATQAVMRMVNIDFGSFLAPYLPSLSNFFSNLVRQQRAEDLQGHMNNEKEIAQTQEELSATKFVLEINGDRISGHIETSGSMWDKDMDEGHPAPMIGGSGGVITNPDESSEPSTVRKNLQGTNNIESYAEEGSPVWRDNAMKMIKTLLPDYVRDIIAFAKDKIAELIAPMIIPQIQEAMT